MKNTKANPLAPHRRTAESSNSDSLCSRKNNGTNIRFIALNFSFRLSRLFRITIVFMIWSRISYIHISYPQYQFPYFEIKVPPLEANITKPPTTIKYFSD